MTAKGSATRRLTIEVPRELYDWLLAAAEISHRTTDTMVTDVLERERARWDANWDPPRADPNANPVADADR